MNAFRARSTGLGGLVLATLLLGPSAACAEHPSGWGGGGLGYELSKDNGTKHQGKASGSVKAIGQADKGFGTFTQAIRAGKYRGKRLRMTAQVKTATAGGWAALWMRVDGKEKTGLAFDNMMDRAVKGETDWMPCAVVLDIPEAAEEIYFGFLLAGEGQAWVDDIRLEVVGDDVPSTGVPTQESDRIGELTPNLPEEPRNLDFED